MRRRVLATLLLLSLVPLSAASEDDEEIKSACAARARARVDQIELEQGKLALRERELALKSAYDTCLALVEETRAAEAAKAGVAAGTGEAGEAARPEEKKGFDWKAFFLRGANKPRVRSPSGKKVYRE